MVGSAYKSNHTLHDSTAYSDVPVTHTHDCWYSDKLLVALSLFSNKFCVSASHILCIHLFKRNTMAPLGRTITLNPARRRLHGSKGTPAALQPVAYIYACLQWNTPAQRKPQVPLFPLPVPVFPGASPPWITDLPMTNSHCMPSPCRARHTCVRTWLVHQYTTFTMLACTAQPSTL